MSATQGRVREGKDLVGYLHYCPGCRTSHVVYVDKPGPNGAQWAFDQSFERPSFTPSVHFRFTRPGAVGVDVCHYVISNGQLVFLPDCTHALAGQSMPMPPLPESYG